MADNVQQLPRFQPCGERRTHPAHALDLDDRHFRCPGIESASEQYRHLDELVHRARRERRIVIALTHETG